jgi:hypothetical protein
MLRFFYGFFSFCIRFGVVCSPFLFMQSGNGASIESDVFFNQLLIALFWSPILAAILFRKNEFSRTRQNQSRKSNFLDWMDENNDPSKESQKYFADNIDEEYKL